ncbi:TPA: hypothetical protein N0F65_005718 [Lagenidium giganteum]|uniref:Uncharacterized protein n=1 Tax=Lagenidium giganteum TaxID=4803 RepID=A0AAV2ZFH5_9STRA|nr:TPA: hypothetical protein N0F65_005718 [Lagenidium giganteum]
MQVIKAVQLYYEMFAHGYDSDMLGSERILQYAHSAVEPDVICPDHKGLANLIGQWEVYTRCHGSLTLVLHEIKLVDIDDRFVSVRQRGEFRLGITETTLQKLFPAFYANVLRQSNGTDVIASLIGKEYVMEFVQVMHFVMLTYRRAWRQANRQVEEYRGHSRWGQKDRKKNCAVRRRVLTVDRKRKEELHASIVALQDTIVTMERTQLLADSAHVNARSDRSTLVIKAVQLYYEMFAYGYDSDTVGSERIRQYARSAIDPDVICPDHKGLENLLSQWELYTRCHGHFIVRLAEVKLVDDGDDLVSVRQRGEFRLGITETTLQKLFPAFYAYVQKQPNGADILATLVGKEYVIEFVQVMHYNMLLTNRRAWRQANRQVEEYRGHSCWGRKDRKKNCAVKRQVLTVNRKRKELHASIAALQEAIVTMERTQLLADSARVNARSDRSTLVIKAVQLYYEMFAHGYDSDTVGSERIRQYARSAIDPDVICPDLKGLSNLLGQWELYTQYHGHIVVKLTEVKLVDDEDEIVSVRQRGETRLAITETTLQTLYPTFYTNLQKQPNGGDILAGLVGKEYVLQFDQVLHYNSQCRLLAFEARTQIASGLLEVVQDPFTAIRLTNAALLTRQGNWRLPDQDQVHDALYTLPKSLL